MHTFRIHLARTFALLSLFLVHPWAEGQTVWNVNVGSGVGSGTNQITTANNYIGAAPENTANSTWNGVTSISLTTLADSTGGTSAGVTIEMIAGAGSVIQFGVQNLNSGDKIFNTWIKDGVGPSPDIVNDDPFTVRFGNLNPSATYDLVVYADWWWAPVGNPVTQSAGSGLTGTFFINSQVGGTQVNGIVPPLQEDTNAANVSTNPTNFARFRGLTPNGSGVLSFVMGGVNAPINGFQLIQIASGPADVTPPTPSPMTWLNAPTAAGSSSITMTATTATDASGVEYFFDETSGNPGGSDSGWQSSPIYTDVGLNAAMAYTYTVIARDKSIAQNTTVASAPASATTSAASQSTVWNIQLASQAGNQISPADNFIGAASENTASSTWNRVATLPQSDMALKDSTGANTAVTLDMTSSNNIGTQNLTSGDKIFNSYVGGLGTTSNLTLKGLSMTNSYDIIIYSDWWWSGDGYPVRLTHGSGLTETIYLNRIPKTTNGIVPALTQDSNPANVSSGAGNIGNWFRISGLSPTTQGELGFLLGDGANGPFNGFQLVETPLSPRADMIAFGLPDNDAQIVDEDITLTMPFGAQVTNLAPTFTLWPGATCVPPSGTASNFTTPQIYTVTSSDGLVTKVYTVSAVIAPPLPEFTLTAPTTWNGRTTITVQPQISNMSLLEAHGGTNFSYQWNLQGVAVSSSTAPGVLSLTRSQGSGPLVVSLTISNGTVGVTSAMTILINEPASDQWIERTPIANEKPVTGQFFARNPFTNTGTIFYYGTQSGLPDSVYLKVYRTPVGGAETLDATYRQELVGSSYAFSAPITAGLITYRVVYGTTTGGIDTDLATVSDLVCGDVYIIEGQSNAVATQNSDAQDLTSNSWIRTYGKSGGTWGYATRKGSQMDIGFWGMHLAQNIVSNQQMPVCMINGAIGGTRIDEHQANPANPTVPGALYSIYANLLNRVMGAKLTHGIRGVFWHQGESDCSNFGPISEYDYTAYESNFLAMSAAWKRDYPNFQRYIMFQVMPKPCAIGPKGDELREVQRQLPRLYSKISILNTLGIEGYDGCHFTKAGYENVANRLVPVVNRDFYGTMTADAVTAPNLQRAFFANANRTAVVLEFDQPMSWSTFSLPNYYIDEVANQVTSGTANGNRVTLQLANAAAPTATIDYLKDTIWSPSESVSSLLYGSNAIPALTFANVPIAPLSPYETWSSSKNLSGANAAGDADPDSDGVTNALEFVLGGEPNPSAPGSHSTTLLPQSSRLANGDLIFSFPRKMASLDALSLSFQWSGDLTFLTTQSVSIGSTSSTTNGISVAMSGIDPATQSITITVPAEKAVSGKLFGRLHAVVP